MRYRVLGKSWNVIFQHMPDDDGICDPPEKKGKKIKLRPALRGQVLVEAALHETHHAADWSKDEDWVEEVSRQQAAFLCHATILERVMDDPKLLDKIEHVLNKHGFYRS